MGDLQQFTACEQDLEIGDESILDEATSKHALKEKWTVKLFRNDMPIMKSNAMVMSYLN